MSRRKPVFLLAGDPGNRRAKSDPLVRAVFHRQLRTSERPATTTEVSLAG